MMKAFPKSVAPVIQGKDSRDIWKAEFSLLGGGLHVEGKEKHILEYMRVW